MEGAAAAVGVLMFVSILLLVAVVIFFAQRYKGALRIKSWSSTAEPLALKPPR